MFQIAFAVQKVHCFQSDLEVAKYTTHFWYGVHDDWPTNLWLWAGLWLAVAVTSAVVEGVVAAAVRGGAVAILLQNRLTHSLV